MLLAACSSLMHRLRCHLKKAALCAREMQQGLWKQAARPVTSSMRWPDTLPYVLQQCFPQCLLSSTLPAPVVTSRTGASGRFDHAWQTFVPQIQTASACLHLLQDCRVTEPPLQLQLPIPVTAGRAALHQRAVQQLTFFPHGLPAAGGAEHTGAQRPQRESSLRRAGGVV